MLKAVAFLDFDQYEILFTTRISVIRSSLLEYHNTDVLIFENLCPSILEQGGDEEQEYRSKGDWNGCMVLLVLLSGLLSECTISETR